jgi:CDP-diacylglycerol--serine O-phosphatidyltransferase
MDVAPARRPLRRIRRRPRFKGPSFNQVIPNLITLLGLCAGLNAIHDALDQNWQHAAAFVLAAALFDAADGRVARLLKGTSRFGAEFDSLADFCCFGIAPALILYLWSLKGAGRYGFMPCLMFAVCMALRLARFNATLESAPKPAFAQSFFTGVPAPAGAGVVLFPLCLAMEAAGQGWGWVGTVAQHPAFVAAVLVGTSLLLVSTLPVWSFKNFKVPSEYVLPLLVSTGMMAALMAADPWAAFAACGVIYLGMLPFSLRSFRRLRDDAEQP